MMRLAFIALSVVISCTFAQPKLDFLSDEYIEQLNSKNLPWKAGRNFERDTSLYNIQRLVSVATINPPSEIETLYHEDNGEELPEEFDARKHWSKCESIKEIRDQSGCGSCWAVSSASVMSDRICIHSDQKNQARISAADILECCVLCKVVVGSCDGGVPFFPFIEWKFLGFVSGGEYNSTNGCMSYPFPRCSPSCKERYDSPKCNKKCDKGSKLKYEEDKHYGKRAYMIVSKDERQIQLEILKNGPVVTVYRVYSDFIHYKSGVYTREDHSYLLGSHSVKIIGWGTDNGTYPYWLVSNSWNDRWGDQGLFKIMRGKNECGIENFIIAGLPQ
ncbi:unnamed protein product [Callosobruchus maculatus]|nr:unnamed protein product [Callosobruchus maculatus]